MLIPSDGGSEPARTEAEPVREMTGSSALAQLIGIAFICASCWLAIGLLVLAALSLGHGWLEPLLIAAALVVGAGVAFLPVVLYRDRLRTAEAMLDSLIGEAPEQALVDAAASEPELYLRVERLRVFRRRTAE